MSVGRGRPNLNALVLNSRVHNVGIQIRKAIEPSGSDEMMQVRNWTVASPNDNFVLNEDACRDHVEGRDCRRLDDFLHGEVNATSFGRTPIRIAGVVHHL